MAFYPSNPHGDTSGNRPSNSSRQRVGVPHLEYAPVAGPNPSIISPPPINSIQGAYHRQAYPGHPIVGPPGFLVPHTQATAGPYPTQPPVHGGGPMLDWNAQATAWQYPTRPAVHGGGPVPSQHTQATAGPYPTQPPVHGGGPMLNWNAQATAWQNPTQPAVHGGGPVPSQHTQATAGPYPTQPLVYGGGPTPNWNAQATAGQYPTQPVVHGGGPIPNWPPPGAPFMQNPQYSSQQHPHHGMDNRTLRDNALPSHRPVLPVPTLPEPHAHSSMRSTTPKAPHALLPTNVHTARLDKTPTRRTYKDGSHTENATNLRGPPLLNRGLGMDTAFEQMPPSYSAHNQVTHSVGPPMPPHPASLDVHAYGLRPTLPPHTASTDVRAHGMRPLAQQAHPSLSAVPTSQSRDAQWSSYVQSKRAGARNKPSWIVGTLTPAYPATGFALECPIGKYFLRDFTHIRYGPASLSSGGKLVGKLRPCFVTFVDGPFAYLAPMLSAVEHTDKPFMASLRSTWDWWLPVQWMVYKNTPGPAPPDTPTHPWDNQRTAVGKYQSTQGSADYEQARPGSRRPNVIVDWQTSPVKMKSSFIWSGDPGDRIDKPTDVIPPDYPLARHLDAEQIELLKSWWNELWNARLEPPRPD